MQSELTSRLPRWTTIACGVVGLLAGSLAVSPPAEAGLGSTVPPASCSGSTCTVDITYTGNGAPGPSGGSSAPAVEPDCWYEPWLGLKQAFALRAITDVFGFFIPLLDLPMGEVKEYADAVKKHKSDPGWKWYKLTCKDGINSITSDQAMNAAETTEWFGMQVARMDLLVGPGEDTPEGVSVETLLEAAQAAITIPDPQVVRNPQIGGSGATMVNLDTFFWSETAQKEYTVTATAGNVSATVTAKQDGYVLTSPAGSTECTHEQFTTAWSRGLADDAGCRIGFDRASARGWDVEVMSQWDATWTATGFPDAQPLDALTVGSTTSVPVFESQALVTGVD